MSIGREYFEICIVHANFLSGSSQRQRPGFLAFGLEGEEHCWSVVSYLFWIRSICIGKKSSLFLALSLSFIHFF